MSKGNKIFEGIDFSGFDTLDELDARSKQATTPTNYLPLSSIIEDPEQPRTTFQDDKLEELANSIRERGLIQAITVRPADANGKYMIVSGARRYRASRLAGQDTILAVIRSEASNSYDQMIENIQREALSHRDTATFIRDQMATGAKKSAIAKSLGKPPAWVTAYADFFDMDPAIQDGMEEYGTRAAYELHAAMQLDETATRRFLASDEPITRRTAAAFHQALKASDTSTGSSSKQGRSAGTTPKGEAKAPSQPQPKAAPAGTSSNRGEGEGEAVPPVDPSTVPSRSEEDGTDMDSREEPPVVEEGRAPVLAPARALEPRQSVGNGRAKISLAMLVHVGGRTGRLVQDREANKGRDHGIVLFDDGSEEVRLADLVLVELVAVQGEENDDA